MTSDYRSSVDLLRFLAAFGIVWAHMLAPLATLGHSALALFLVLTGFLTVQSLDRSGKGFSLLGRARRILTPWIAFCVFFKALEMAMAPDPWAVLGLTDPWWLLIGPTIHLWFLPFLLLVSPLALLVARMVRDRRDVAIGSMIATVLSLELLTLHVYSDLPVPLPQWTFAIPPFLYGLLLAKAHRLRCVWMPLGFIALVSVVVFAVTGEDWPLQYLLAALLFEGFWRLRIGGRLLPALGQLAFGIYLIHPLFILVVFKFLGPDVDRALGALVAFALSATAAFATQQALGRWRRPRVQPPAALPEPATETLGPELEPELEPAPASPVPQG